MWTISRALRRSTFSPDQAEVFSADYCVGGGLSAPSSSTSTAGRSSSPGRTTELLSRSRFGTMFVRSTDCHGEDAVTSCAAGSPAPRSLLSGNGPVSADRSRAFGAKWPESSERSGRPGSSPKTLPISRASDSTSCYRILPRSGMMRNGAVSPRPSSAPPTSGTGFGFWGAPGKPLPEEERLRLFAQIDAQAESHHALLPPKTFEFWPTPTYSDAKNCGSLSQLKRKYIPLSCRVRMYRSYSGKNTIFMREEPGHPNPMFVAWLMGFPSTWSSLEAMETRRFLSWLHGHFSILQEDLRKTEDTKGKEIGTCRRNT